MFRSLCQGVVGLMALAAAWNAAPTPAQAQLVTGAYFSRPGFTSAFVTGGSYSYYSNGRVTFSSGYTMGGGGYRAFSYYQNPRFTSALAVGNPYGWGYPNTGRYYPYRRGSRR